MIYSLTGRGVTIVSTVEIPEGANDSRFSSYSISFLTDDIIRLSYIEIEGRLRRVLTVVKMRRGDHSKEIREYEISPKGFVIGECLYQYDQLTTGTPTPTTRRKTGA